MRPSPGLVLAAILVLIATQLTRLVIPGRGPYVWTLFLSVAALVCGEVVAQGGHLDQPALGALHPLADVVAIVLFQAAGALVITPRRRPPADA